MNRRELLAVSGASVVPGVSGCIDRSDGAGDGDGEDFANEVEARQAEYESAAEPLAFEVASVESFKSTRDGYIPLLPGGLRSDEADSLSCIRGCGNVRRSVTVYGFVLTSAEAAGRLSEEVLGSPGKRFLEETNFETESLLLLQQGQPQISNGFEITFLGDLEAEGKSYLAFRSKMGGGEAPAFISRLLRIDRPTMPESLLVGQAHKFDVSDDARFNHAIYTNDP